MALRAAILQTTTEQKTLPKIEFKTHVNVIKKPPYQNPSPHVISVLTLICDIGKIIDINTRAFTYGVANDMYLLNHSINDSSNTMRIIQIQHVTESFNAIELKETLEETFNNQCTMIVEKSYFNNTENNMVKKHIYVKLFNTGTLHFTGLNSMDDAEQCTNMIIERIKRQQQKSLVLENILDQSILNENILDKKYRKSYVQSTNINSYKDIEILTRYDIFCNFIKFVPLKDIYRLTHVCKKFYTILRDEQFWQYCIKQQFQMNYKKNKNGYIPINGFVKQNKKEKPNKRITSLKPVYFNLRTCAEQKNEYRPIVRFYPLYDNETFQMSNQSIEMINSNFTTHFCINQRALTKILQKENPFLNISFEPDDKYHGIKIYWPCPLGSLTTINEKNNQSLITKIFISVFRTGSILMSGAKEYSQLTHAYDFINDTIKRHYDKIWIPNDLDFQ